MAVPKKKRSYSKIRSRSIYKKLNWKNYLFCPNCGHIKKVSKLCPWCLT